MRRVFLPLIPLALLAACGGVGDDLAFDGKYFRSDLKLVSGRRDHFVVTVRDATQSLEGARAAGRHEAIAHCVGTYGSSDIKWIVGPDTPGQALQLSDGALRFEGICPQ
ncbi:hypothetical protein ACFSUD_03350 [Sulfitobacter aestuarii]|uniref:Lipoprotein n=1 Tax=Sulfitobacter aestuarii TaxID=2161676 RepID=A0ABW5TY81_9RHOB